MYGGVCYIPFQLYNLFGQMEDGPNVICGLAMADMISIMADAIGPKCKSWEQKTDDA
jgi:hypothetical protein